MNRDLTKIPIERYVIVGYDSAKVAYYFHEPSGLFMDSSFATIYEESPSPELIRELIEKNEGLLFNVAGLPAEIRIRPKGLHRSYKEP